MQELIDTNKGAIFKTITERKDSLIYWSSDEELQTILDVIPDSIQEIIVIVSIFFSHIYKWRHKVVFAEEELTDRHPPL